MIDIRRLICIFGVVLVSFASWGQREAPAGAKVHSVGSCGVIERSDSPCVLLDSVLPGGVPLDDRSSGLVMGQSTLEEGTIVELRLTRTMQARHLQSHTFGQRVDLEVTSDVVIGDQVVIAAGTEAWGSIRDSSKAPGRFFTPGSLSVAVEGTRAITGDIVQLSASFDVEGEPLYCDDDAACGFAVLLFGPFTKGNDAVARKGSHIAARVVESLTFDRAAIARIPLARRVSDELQHARDHGRGLVVVYRQPDDGCRTTWSTNSGRERPVWCGKAALTVDDHAAVALPAGCALQIEVSPGEHSLRVSNGEGAIVTVAAGSIQYVRIHISSWKRHAQMSIVAAEVGEPESYSLKSRSRFVSGVTIHRPWALVPFPE